MVRRNCIIDTAFIRAINTMQSAREARALVKGQIIAYYKVGYTSKDIASAVKCSERTVRKYIQRYHDMGEEGLWDWRRYNGRVSKTTDEEDRAIINEMARDPSQSVSTVAANLDLSVSESTVRNRLREAGLLSRRPERKGRTIRKRRTKRVAFKLEPLPKSQSDWDSIIFMGKAIFSSSVDTVTLSICQSNTDVNLNGSEHITYAVWGWVSMHGPGEMIEISPDIDSSGYIDILENTLLPSVRSVYPEKEMPVIRLVQSDSALHDSTVVQEWFLEHPMVCMLQWPVKLSSLNVIEGVWTRIIETWQSTDIAITRDALKEHVVYMWEQLRSEPETFEGLRKKIQDQFGQTAK